MAALVGTTAGGSSSCSFCSSAAATTESAAAKATTTAAAAANHPPGAVHRPLFCGLGFERKIEKLEFSGFAELTIDNEQLTIEESLRDDLD